MPKTSVPGLLVIRADATATVGGGHVMRCLAVADQWINQHSNAQVVFLCAEISQKLTSRLQAHGHAVKSIDVERGSSQDALATSSFAIQNRADAIIFDGYCFNHEYQHQVYDKSYLSVVYDDEAIRNKFWCDVIVNQNISANPEYYRKIAPKSNLLMGTDYAALRPEFRKLHQQARSYSGNTDILISLGLSDTREILKSILSGLSMFTLNTLNIEILTGKQYLAELESFGVDIHHNVQCNNVVTDFAQKLYDTDMAILASGGTANEAACLGTPMLLVCIADNQRPAYEEYVVRGIALGGGLAGNIYPDTIVHQTSRLLGESVTREQCGTMAHQAVDGHGAMRVVKEISALINQK